jgi:NAD(P)-dependent dehydrogenase (short-subunit alcohol dehydrogenase family)
MQRDFSGKVVVVTGAAAGIGLAMAETFAQNGAKLALVDRDLRVVEVAKKFADSRAYVLDVSDASAVEQTFAKIGADFGTIHVLINNAGIGLMGPAESLPVADWDKTMSVNLRGQYLCARAAAPFMLRQKWGRVVTMASQAAVIGIEGHVAYSASKAGLIGMTNVLALEWGPFGVTANCISPTVVETELGRVNWGGEKGDKARAAIPTRRFAQPSEVAETALFLASDAAAMINGANLMLDGGNTIQ